MTSKHYFSNYMRQDLKHKTWMLALSILGNMLALPIAFMIVLGNMNYRYDMNEAREQAMYIIRSLGGMVAFFDKYALGLGGVIAVGGAIIVGLASFRYLQNKSMSDTFQSIPLKRRDLFLTGYLNGIILWAVPYLGSLLLTLLIAITKFVGLKNEWQKIGGEKLLDMELFELPTMGHLLLIALRTTVILLLIYLLVYHLMLLAYMLAGNMINTLVLAAIIGAGAISVYGCFMLYNNYYLLTHIERDIESIGLKLGLWLSPAALVITDFVYFMADNTLDFSYIIVSVVMTIALGVGAYIAFLKRPTELAEQGVKKKWLTLTCQVLVSFIGAVGGWAITTALVNVFAKGASLLIWGIGGAVLVGGFVFGVLDVIFNMDFKAFFKHYKWMILAIGLSLVVSISYYYDLFGYDTYLPKKEQIESIAVGCDDFMSWSGRFDRVLLGENETGEALLDKMKFTNADVAYDFLKIAAKSSEIRRLGDRGREVSVVIIDAAGYMDDYDTLYWEDMYVKVTLKSGRSYYRRYMIPNNVDTTACYEILSSPEYLTTMCQVPDKAINLVQNADIYNDFETAIYNAEDYEIGRVSQLAMDKETVRKIVIAYNEEVLKHPELILLGNGHEVSEFSMHYFLDGRYQYFYLTFYEEMESVMQVLRESGLETFTKSVQSNQVKELQLISGWWVGPKSFEDPATALGNFMNSVIAQYGVDYDMEAPFDREAVREQMIQEGILCRSTKTDVYTDTEAMDLSITNPEEIATLMEQVRFSMGRRGLTIFGGNDGGGVNLIDKEGIAHDCYLEKGALPKKYIDYFRVMYEDIVK